MGMFYNLGSEFVLRFKRSWWMLCIVEIFCVSLSSNVNKSIGIWQIKNYNWFNKAKMDRNLIESFAILWESLHAYSTGSINNSFQKSIWINGKTNKKQREQWVSWVGFGNLLCLDFVKSSNVHALNELIEFLDLFGKPIDRYFVIFDDAGNGQLLDTVSQWHQSGGTPQQTIANDCAHLSFHLSHIGFIVLYYPTIKEIKVFRWALKFSFWG